MKFFALIAVISLIALCGCNKKNKTEKAEIGKASAEVATKSVLLSAASSNPDEESKPSNAFSDIDRKKLVHANTCVVLYVVINWEINDLAETDEMARDLIKHNESVARFHNFVTKQFSDKHSGKSILNIKNLNSKEILDNLRKKDGIINRQLVVKTLKEENCEDIYKTDDYKQYTNFIAGMTDDERKHWFSILSLKK